MVVNFGCWVRKQNRIANNVDPSEMVCLMDLHCLHGYSKKMGFDILCKLPPKKTFVWNVKSCFLVKKKEKTILKSYMQKSGLCLTWKSNNRAIPPLFCNIFNIFLTLEVKLYIHLWNVLVQFVFFLNSTNLICQWRDISQYFRENLGFRDDESQLYHSDQLQIQAFWVSLFLNSCIISANVRFLHINMKGNSTLI